MDDRLATPIASAAAGFCLPVVTHRAGVSRDPLRHAGAHARPEDRQLGLRPLWLGLGFVRDRDDVESALPTRDELGVAFTSRADSDRARRRRLRLPPRCHSRVRDTPQRSAQPDRVIGVDGRHDGERAVDYCAATDGRAHDVTRAWSPTSAI